MTNVEADQLIRAHIESSGVPYSPMDTTLCTEEWTDSSPVARGVSKNEMLDAETDIEVVSGLVACRAMVALPGAERFFKVQTEGALIIGISLGWQDLNEEVNVSKAHYYLEQHEPALIDAHYQKMSPAEREAANRDTDSSSKIQGVKIKFEQVVAESRKNDKDKGLANRARIIRSFKEQYPFLTILSTTTGGNIHDDEIPLLAEWLIESPRLSSV